MITVTGGKIISNYRSDLFMGFILDADQTEYPINKCYLVQRETSRDMRSELSAVEQACNSFLYRYTYSVKNDYMNKLPFLKLKVLYIHTEMGKPKVREEVFITFKTVEKQRTIKLSKGRFSIEVLGGEVEAPPKILTLEYVENNECKVKPNLLIRRR